MTDSLPDVTGIRTATTPEGNRAVKAYFDNNAVLEYRREHGRVVEQTYAPGDDSVWARSVVAAGEQADDTSPDECMIESLEYYTQSDRDSLKRDWTPLHEVFAHTEGKP